MKLRIYTLAVFVVFMFAGRLASQDDLTPVHRRWLEDVDPIITKAERDVFRQLKKPEERSKFIQFFWKQRDPLPDTLENEFFREYMERVRFADRNFGHGSAKRGSQTERGYYYLLLGPPLERQRFTTQAEIVPTELWYCKGEPLYGLPPYFYLIFYQPDQMGEYRLFNPGMEGPERLIVLSMSLRAFNRNAALELVQKVSSELASASLSYLPGEQSRGLSSLSSATIVATIRSVPERKFSDGYARSFLNYKDFIETEYADSFVESTYLAKVFRTAGQNFLHWAVEPSKVNLASGQDVVYASYDLVLRVEDMEGRVVLENQEEIPLRLSPEQYRKHERTRFAIQDLLPVIPGSYKMFFLLKNKTARDFTSFEIRFSIPEESASLSLGSPLLYLGKEPSPEIPGQGLKAFSFEGNVFVFNTRNEFSVSSPPGIYVQILGALEEADREQTWLQLEIRWLDTDTVVLSERKSLREVLTPSGQAVDIPPLTSSSFRAGYYQATLTLQNARGKPLASCKENFILYAQAIQGAPWAFSRQHPPFPHQEHLNFLGIQYFSTGAYGKAKTLLEESLRLADSFPVRTMLAKTLYALGNLQGSLNAALPVFEKTRDREAAKVIALDYAGLKDWRTALVYLEELLSQATEIGVLNLAGECHFRLGQFDKAVPLFEKSLELIPDQPTIREMAEEAQKRLKDFKERS